MTVNFGLLSFVHIFTCQQELIQNADDAGATEVVFIHDERSYGTENLWTDELGKYQGALGSQGRAVLWVVINIIYNVLFNRNTG